MMNLIQQFEHLPEQQQLAWTVGVSFGLVTLWVIVDQIMTIPRKRRLINWIEYAGPRSLLYWEWFQQLRQKLNQAADQTARCYQKPVTDPLHIWMDIGPGYQCRNCSTVLDVVTTFWVPGTGIVEVKKTALKIPHIEMDWKKLWNQLMDWWSY